jgi:hypothetical protein
VREKHPFRRLILEDDRIVENLSTLVLLWPLKAIARNCGDNTGKQEKLVRIHMIYSETVDATRGGRVDVR